MSIFTNLLHLFKGGARRQAGSEKAARGGDPGIGREEAAAWLAAFESGDFRIPEDVHDPAGWDRYWSAQLQHGGLEQGFNDMMANNPELIALLRKRRARAILCAGNGISSEAYALALHGFDVTVLDVSTVPNALFAAIVADSDHAFHSIPGFTVRGDAHVTFEGDRLIDPAQCPRMHQSDAHPPVAGGSLKYVTGSVFDPDACPGPFDAVIERRTIQLFRPAERPRALERLASRLGPAGLLVSHEHQGRWTPEQPRQHFADGWIAQNGFVSLLDPAAENAGRVAYLYFSTG